MLPHLARMLCVQEASIITALTKRAVAARGQVRSCLVQYSEESLGLLTI
jgi:hypothetical protein